MAVITKNMKNTGRMTMDFVTDLAIDSLRLLERMFFSLVLILHLSITRGLRTLFIGVQATRSSFRIQIPKWARVYSNPSGPKSIGLWGPAA